MTRVVLQTDGAVSVWSLVPLSPLGFGRVRTCVIFCVAATALAATPVLAQSAPFVPTFVDPQHHVDKPDLGAIRSLRLLTSDDYPPFNFAAPDGTLTGFNVDLAREICALLEVACSIQVRAFDTLVPALLANAGNAVIASLAISDPAKAEVAFSIPTMKTPARFAGRSGALPPVILPEAMAGVKVGVQAGTAHEAYLRRFFPKVAVTRFNDPESLRAALKAGGIDLLFADGIATSLWLNGTAAARCCRFAGGPFTESRYFGEGSGIAVRKGDVALKQALDYALAKLSAEGVIGDLYLKYFPVGFY